MPLWQLGAWPNASLALMGKLSSELLQSFQIGFLVSLPVAHRRDGCDPINALSDPEKRLRMYIASICTLGVNSFPRISLGIRFRIASMARFS